MNRNFEILDSKLKTLIQLCKENKNYRRISIVFFHLLNDVINQIGPKLAIRTRNEKKKEMVYEYMEYINKKYFETLNVLIFKSYLIEMVKRIENLYLRNNCLLPYENLKELITLYYDLRDLKFPNFNTLINRKKSFNIPELDMFNYLIHEDKAKYRGSGSDISTLVLQKKIQQAELELQKKLRHAYNPDDIEELIHLKRISEKLNSKHNGKILLQGTLKDDIMYNLSKKRKINYFILGLAVCSLSIVVLILIEMRLFPTSINGLTLFLLISIFLSVILFYILNKLSKRQHI